MVAAVSPAFSAAAPAPRAMISGAVDLLCIGGLSLVISVFLLAFGKVPFDQQVPALVPYVLTVAITWPHFLSSYRLLYSTRESVLTYRTASLYFPIALAACGLFALSQTPENPVYVQLLSMAAGVYLARHYTGQTWGMMATFSYLGGTPFTANERRISRLSLDLIMAWHILWAVQQSLVKVFPSVEPWVQRLGSGWMYVDAVGVFSFAIGLVALGQMTRRLGRVPDARVVVAWVALYGWYALLRNDPTSLIVVQLAHALQYLIFPLRIEENRRQRDHVTARVRPARMLAWLVGLTGTGLAVFAGIPMLFKMSYADAGGAGDLSIAFTSVFVSFVNIHHYFVDGSLYKLRNPTVRRDLFAHLAPAQA